jgi:hypothetical protein
MEGKQMSKIFNSLTDLQEELKQNDFQNYGLEEGLLRFENHYLGSYGSSQENDLNFESFSWRTEEGKDIEIEIAITSKEQEGIYTNNYHVIGI